VCRFLVMDIGGKAGLRFTNGGIVKGSLPWERILLFCAVVRACSTRKILRQCRWLSMMFAKSLALGMTSAAREVIAVRIIDLARAGERSPTRLRDRVLHEARMVARVNLDDECRA
jgi:hypothetical protein